MNPDEIFISNSSWDSIFEEFFIIGVISSDQAQSLFIHQFYPFNF